MMPSATSTSCATGKLCAVRLTSCNGNVYGVMAVVETAIKRAGHIDKANEFTKRCFQATSYDNVLQIVMEYVEVE